MIRLAPPCSRHLWGGWGRSKERNHITYEERCEDTAMTSHLCGLTNKLAPRSCANTPRLTLLEFSSHLCSSNDSNEGTQLCVMHLSSRCQKAKPRQQCGHCQVTYSENHDNHFTMAMTTSKRAWHATPMLQLLPSMTVTSTDWLNCSS